jgi:hypothetical protein
MCYDNRQRMVYLATIQSVCWGLSISLRALLLCLVLWQRNARSLPFFSAYLFINLLNAFVLAVSNRVLDPHSPILFQIAWGSQLIISCARALAVAEICRLLFAGYRGIWSLTWRVLLCCAGLALLYASLVSKHQWSFAILGLNRAVELAIAVVIVVLLVFLRHYQVVAEPTLRSLVIGFCLFSCFEVLNYTILEHWLAPYGPIWNFLEVIAYMACVLIWTRALWKSLPQPIPGPALLPAYVYGQLAPEINLRLRLLDERLSHFWRAEGPRS